MAIFDPKTLMNNALKRAQNGNSPPQQNNPNGAQGPGGFGGGPGGYGVLPKDMVDKVKEFDSGNPQQQGMMDRYVEYQKANPTDTRNYFGSADQAAHKIEAAANRDKYADDVSKFQFNYDRGSTNQAINQYNQLGAQAENMMHDAKNRNAPQMNAVAINPNERMNAAQIGRSDQPFEQGQMGLVNALQQQAAGKGPSLATNQMQQNVEQSLQAAASQQASQRGRVNPALAARNMANQTASANQNAAMQSAQMRMQEQMNAQGQLGNALSQARGQSQAYDLNQANLNQNANQFNAEQTNRTNLNQANLANEAGKANMEAKLRQTGMNDAQVKAMMGAQMGAVGSALGADVGFQGMQSQDWQNAVAMKEGKDGRDMQTGASMAAGGMAALAGLAALSDEKEKTDITEPKPTKVQNALHSLANALNSTSQALSQSSQKSGGSISPMQAYVKAGGKTVMDGAKLGIAGLENDDPFDSLLMSDEKEKTSVSKPSERKVDDFLDNIKAYEYRYKNPEYGEHKYISPMAQDIEKSELGKGMVEEHEGKKTVNYARALGTMLAAQGQLNDKVNTLESRLQKALKMKRG